MSPDVVSKISEFANLHKDDERCAFKEAWTLWCQENENLITLESQRLVDSGYEGDVQDKMFKACRYYFRKKMKKKSPETGAQVETQTRDVIIEEAEERKESMVVPIKKRGYIKLQTDTLECIDNHIKKSFCNNDFTPANGYKSFAEEHVAVFRNEKTHLEDFGMTEMEVQQKLKKTYKNRYYSISRSQINN